MKKIPVAVLGATGMVGQHYIALLAEHPWFEVKFLAASEQSAGKSYSEAVSGRWFIPSIIPKSISTMKVQRVEEIEASNCTCVFSAMNNDGAKIWEECLAEKGFAVLSNASYHRMARDIPIIIPEVNPDHSQVIHLQRKNRHWEKGFIAVKPNCSLQSFIIPLKPLHDRFEVKKIIITTLQATSGAGYPGISSLDIVDNVIPYISGEEEKSEQESLKIWGIAEPAGISLNSKISISVHCNRVPVLDGHLACVSVEFTKKPELEEIIPIWQNFQGVAQQLNLPSAPLNPIEYREEKDRPQPRLDRHAGKGMTITVGRLRPCNLLHYRFTALSHNTIRGAAGGNILNAELLYKKGFIQIF